MILLFFLLVTSVGATSLGSLSYSSSDVPVRVIAEKHSIFKGKTTDPLLEIRYLRADFLDSLYFQFSQQTIPLIKTAFLYFRANTCDSLVLIDSVKAEILDKGMGQLKIPTIFTFEDSVALVLSVRLHTDVSLLNQIAGRITRVRFSELNQSFDLNEKVSPWNELAIGSVVRDFHQDGVNTYRIPGIVRTKTGRLVAVYDVRYHSVWDLPGDIDVGMSFSDDDGATWSEMKIIMHKDSTKGVVNGIGDPSILYDPINDRIWVAALWSHGDNGFFGSGSGLLPEQTGQLILVNSPDNGRTWTEPVSITPQIKNPTWKILFQGPGSGIGLSDGTLIFPAQYRDEKGVPFSTIIYSRDGGFHWQIGKGALANTTEAAVAQITHGELLLNMRNNSGGYRSLATTNDWGIDWNFDSTAQKELIDPICMGSMIGFDVDNKRILAFSNPHTQKGRSHLAAQFSHDDGHTWPIDFMVPVDDRKFYGYSSLVYMGQNHVGIFYEGTGNLLFTVIKIPDLEE